MVLLLACAPPPLEQGTFESMGSPIDVLVHGDGERATRLVEEAFAEVEADPESAELLLEAERIRVLTDGAFDVGWNGGVDVGGIAKGWALDRAADRLVAEGMSDFCLSAGGQVLVRGEHEGRAWRVGVRAPGAPLHVAATTLELTDASVSTSAQYERPGHIVDPRTGETARGTGSATVIAPTATRADALSTALFVLGPDDGALLAERLALEVLFL
jgi:FAD:protein FMN transferase